VALKISLREVERSVFRIYVEQMYERSRNMQLLKERIRKEVSSKSYIVPPDSSYEIFPRIKLICNIQYIRKLQHFLEESSELAKNSHTLNILLHQLHPFPIYTTSC
jgi:Uncharacterized flavoproteins